MNRKSKSPKPEDQVDKALQDTEKFLKKALNEIPPENVLSQVICGSFSGLLSGIAIKKLGIIAGGIVAGGSYVAHQQGYFNLDWTKINKSVDKLTDKIEKEASGSTPAWTDKLERFVDRKLDKAESLLKKQEAKTKKWYHAVTKDEHYRATETHVFLASFIAGLAIGLMFTRH